MTTQPSPAVSVIMAAYKSEATIIASLETMLAQTYTPLEIVVVDSSPSDAAARQVRDRFPQVKMIHSPTRLLPHAARNQGVAASTGHLLLFTDPDIYAPTNWVSTLVDAYQKTQGIVAGSVLCHGNVWLDCGIHLAKFDMWLPGGPLRQISTAPTANLLCSRRTFDSVGPFQDHINGDTVWCWEAVKSGQAIWLEPKAVVEHHHVSTWRDFIRERYPRGYEFAQFRAGYEQWPVLRVIVYALLTLFIPLGLVRVMLRVLANAARAGLVWDYIRTFPVILLGETVWLAGETAALLRNLTKRFIVRP